MARDVVRSVGRSYVERVVVMLVVTLLCWAKLVEHQMRMMHSQSLLLNASE